MSTTAEKLLGLNIVTNHLNDSMSTKHEGSPEGTHWEKVSEVLDLPVTTPAPKSQQPSSPINMIVSIIKPSYFSKSRKPVKIHRTSYLDGLRGFAAFLVYILHHQLWAHEAIKADRIFENSFGYEGQYYFACIPFVRTFFSGGHLAVTTFFIISGYVLSAKPLTLIEAGEYKKLGDNLASAFFRRWMRLYIPIIATTFIWLSTWHLLRVRPTNPQPQSTYSAEIWNWYAEFKNFSFVFKTEGEIWFSYNFHAWSIPMEFRGSIVIYTSLLAFSRCTRTARLWCEAGMIFYFLYVVDGWFCALFSSGMLMCDLDLLAIAGNLPAWINSLKPYKTVGFYVMFFTSLYLGGVPSHSLDIMEIRKNPGWYYLSFLKPQAVFNPKWFYLFWAATCVTMSIPRVSLVKSFFETQMCQYLGKISFSFYLVHGPILWYVGDRLYAATGMIRESHGLMIPGWINRFPITTAGPLGLELAFLAPHIILLPLTLWVAEIAMRLFDEPSVTFSRWAYSLTQEPKY